MSEWDFRSQDADEVQEFLGGIYAENEFELVAKRGCPSRTRIYGVDLGEIAQYNVSYSSPFTFLSEAARDSFLILSCTAGNAQFSRGCRTIQFQAGVSGPISATQESRVRSGAHLAHISTHINASSVHSLCSRLLGRTLDAPVEFDLVPFSIDLKANWDLLVRALGQLTSSTGPASERAVRSLTEYAITLLLEKHPHNYSAHLERRETLRPGKVREAQDFIDAHSQSITVADVAAHVGCSIRALQDGFCKQLGLTPRAYLYLSRTAQSRQARKSSHKGKAARALASPESLGSARTQAMAASALWSDSSDIFQRCLRNTHNTFGPILSHSRGGLTAEKIDLLRHCIDTSLGRRITVEHLSSVVHMSPQSFNVAFKQAFKTTPAKYVLGERLKWARWLLTHTDASIPTVASETGFSSQSHLTSALKNRVGETPFALRKASHA